MATADRRDINGTRYTVLFAVAVCVVCALMVAAAAVVLQPRQEQNQRQYMQKNVLLATGLIEPDSALSDAELRRIFDARIEARLLDFATDALVPADRIDAAGYDTRRARNDPATSRAAPPNRAGISRIANYGLVYFVKPTSADARATPEQIVIAVEGLGMWGTIYGFLALAPDGNTVTGLTYYDQKETPGLGGEIGNPKWLALWRGRKIFDENWEPRITVIKGAAGPPEKDPQRVDGLSGATITSNAVTRLMQFWLSDEGYGRYLKSFRNGGGA
jgi:Na+-transporting NADH:ubiquinone oxidoreductase subunit C